MTPTTPYRNVWAASAGEYSGYRVHCLFECQADAETYCADDDKSAREPEFVEEFRLYGPGQIPRHWTVWAGKARVGITEADDEAPQIWPCRRVSEATTDDEGPEVVPTELRSREEGHRSFYAHGPDRESVLKSVSDRYAKARAERDGL